MQLYINIKSIDDGGARALAEALSRELKLTFLNLANIRLAPGCARAGRGAAARAGADQNVAFTR